jgi:SH3-like domain-containing protein
MKRAALVTILLTLALTGRPAPAEEPDASTVFSRFSGKPVPRFETLRWAEVNGRVGPSLSYPIAWRYSRKGLPVLIIKESGDWRRIRDPGGDEAWIHGRMLEEGGRTALVTQPALLQAQPAPDANGIAQIAPGVVVDIDECVDSACRVKAGEYRGWIARERLWGIDSPPRAGIRTNG